jgi:serine/threonine protein phosphatase PrpC
VIKTSPLQNVISKYSFATKGGHKPLHPNRHNQDNYITHPHLFNMPHCHLFGVCDGHGQNGY